MFLLCFIGVTILLIDCVEALARVVHLCCSLLHLSLTKSTTDAWATQALAAIAAEAEAEEDQIWKTGPVMKLRVESALTARLIEFDSTFDGYDDKNELREKNNRSKSPLRIVIIHFWGGYKPSEAKLDSKE